MRIWMLPGLVFPCLVAATAPLLAAAADQGIAQVIGAIVSAYLTLVWLAIAVVRRWAREMAA